MLEAIVGLKPACCDSLPAFQNDLRTVVKRKSIFMKGLLFGSWTTRLLHTKAFRGTH